MGKRKCSFTDKLKSEFKFIKQTENDSEKLRCSICSGVFSISHKGRRNIEEHITTEKHKRAANAASTSNITSFFTSREFSSNELECAAKEATFSYHTAVHELSFKTSDCTSQLIKNLYDCNFSSARTKTEAIITNVISPFVFNDLINDLKKVNYITVTIDCSNRKEVKLVPIVVRYFCDGVKIKLLAFEELPGEKAEMLCNYLLNILNKHALKEKVICLSADNTNTNFGGPNRKGEENVFKKLKTSLNRPIFGIGCSAHIINNTVHTACDALPLDVEVVVVKIYKYFHIHTVRVSNLKEFCDFVETQYKKLLSHCGTRFLSLLPAVERILSMFSALKSLFLSSENGPKFLIDFFEKEENEIYLMFLHGTLQLFQKTILKLESDNINAIEASAVYSELITNLKERKENNFIPFSAKQLYVKLKNNNQLNEQTFNKNVQNFYNSAINYLEMWQVSFDKTDIFSWINLQDKIGWSDLESSCLAVNEVAPNSVSHDELFDERTHVNLVVEKLKKEWDCKETQSQDKPVYLSIEEKWKSVFTVLEKSNVSYKNMYKLVEFCMCLPGTSAPIERVFSIMNNIWSPERGRLHVSTVRELLTIKFNCKLKCVDFYNMIKSNKQLLNKVASSSKYNVVVVNE